MKLNEPGRQTLEGLNSWQQAKQQSYILTRTRLKRTPGGFWFLVHGDLNFSWPRVRRRKIKLHWWRHWGISCQPDPKTEQQSAVWVFPKRSSNQQCGSFQNGAAISSVGLSKTEQQSAVWVFPKRSSNQQCGSFQNSREPIGLTKW